MNTQATVFNPFLGCHVGDYDLVATIDTLDETVKQNWKI
jgi:hypothetical protein